MTSLREAGFPIDPEWFRPHLDLPLPEAEGRRLARFDPFGLTGGRFDPGPPDIHPDFPLTLDLRRFH
jgi:uncharacterized protein (DUF2126 family)